MKAHVTINYIIITINIPVISKIKEIYTQHLQLLIRDDLLLYINPGSLYIIKNDETNEIGFLSEQDVNNCWMIDQENRICLQHYPIYFKQEVKNFCEIDVLTQSKVV